MRNNKIVCSCGGTPDEVEMTECEQAKYNCHKRCCASTYECGNCKTRWVFVFEPPEME